MSANTRLNGKCLCGAVAFTAIPEKHEMEACHCSYCRKWSGGVFLAVNCGHSVEVSADAPLTTYRSSEWGERQFCGQCGSSLFWRAVDDGMTVVAVQAFENPEQFELVKEIFIDQKPAGYGFANPTRQLTGEEFFKEIGVA